MAALHHYPHSKELLPLSLEDLKSMDPRLAELAFDIALSLPEEHAAVFDSEGSLYSLAMLAEKIGAGSTKKEKALAKRMERLFAMCADIGQKIGKSGTINKADVPGSAPKLSAATSKKQLMESEKIIAPKWLPIISNVEEKNLKLKERMEKETSEQRRKALCLAYGLNCQSIELYLAWASGLGNGKSEQRIATAYARRLTEEVKYRSSKENIARIMNRTEPGVVGVEANFDLLAPGIDKAKLDNLRSQGYQAKKILNHNTPEFVQAYASLRVHFGPDELDPSTTLMEMMDAGAIFGKAYQQYFLIIASDKNGRVLGAHDGNYFGNTTTSALYGAHIGVYEEAKRLGLATLMHEAALTVGNVYAADAERQWKDKGFGVDYQRLIRQGTEAGDREPIKGNRLMYFVGEVEPANLCTMESAQATIERNVIHGRMFAFSVIPMIDYKQVDLNWAADKPYLELGGRPPADWETVPLLMYVRRIGKEGATQVAVAEARKISRIMTDIFNEGGGYSAAGVEADYRHSVKRMEGMGENEKVKIIELPRDPKATKAELLAQAIALIPEIGAMHERCEQFYADYMWAKNYLKEYRESVRKGKNVTLEQAREFLINEAKRNPAIEEKRD